MPRKPWIRSAVTTAAVAAFAVTLSAFAGLVPVTNDPLGATTLATAMAANPAVVTGASFVSVPLGGTGTPHATSDVPLSSFPTNGGSFAIMTSGNSQLADDANVAGNSGEDIGGGNVRGYTDYDVSVLAINLAVPATANCLTIDFQFYSDEYPEWVNTQYNDAFIAELDASTWTTLNDPPANTIVAPNNFAFDPLGSVISINASGNTSMTAADAAGTTYDGATPLLSASTQVTPGAHVLYLSIFDQGDHIYDSAVFLDNLVVGYVPNPGQNCVPGAQPKLYSLTLEPEEADNDEGTDHTVTATLLEEGAPLAAANVDFEVTGANPTSGSVLTDGAGEADFTWTGVDEGDDIVTACFDLDGDGACEAVASAIKHWIHVNAPPAAGCVPTTNPSGSNVPGAKASPKAGQNPDGFYELLASDDDSPSFSVYVADTDSDAVFGPYAPGTKVKITQANGTRPRSLHAPGEIGAHLLLNGDARVYAVDDEGAASADVFCYVPRPPK